MRKIGVTLAVLLVSAVVAQAATVVPSTALTLVIAADGSATLLNNTASNVRLQSYLIKNSAAALKPVTNATWYPNVDENNNPLPDGSGTYAFESGYDATRWTPIAEKVAVGGTVFEDLWKLPTATPRNGAGMTGNTGNTGVATAPTNSTALVALGSWGIPGQGSNTTSQIAELTGGNDGWVRTTASGARSISLGIITAPVTNAAALQATFYTTTGGTGTFQWGNSQGEYTGQVVVLPEPATMSLLVIGGIATLIRRRR